ncbi:CDP-alcohol phosphatidyltransferase family protein [Peredibacter starrii]|uniref:CDP-alcohol phosphatidyltransferase family protein n=1 Tax=Peredibacter starrii TaxID=28202 RepID=A0AAX4HUT7_9BACT|nr:CDP-alcohol phosphatidyltransferase family protein [Peredibacter starrii]WPU66953.1 CDP-alcohol phosphatidyltransferase family protein [Peredibacter starrii]
MEKQTARRPLKSRQTAWAKTLSRMIAQAGISPNMISFMSMVFAALSLGSALIGAKTGERMYPILAALFIQMRLICNLMDGMVAVEFGKKSKTGDLWNDVPDRFADVAIILGAGYLSQQYPFAIELAWANGTLAVMTAYLRVLGASLASPHYYIGPMAKPHRMAILTAAFIGEAIYPGGALLYGALIIMVVGQVVTCGRRLSRITVDLENT